MTRSSCHSCCCYTSFRDVTVLALQINRPLPQAHKPKAGMTMLRTKTFDQNGWARISSDEDTPSQVFGVLEYIGTLAQKGAALLFGSHVGFENQY